MGDPCFGRTIRVQLDAVAVVYNVPETAVWRQIGHKMRTEQFRKPGIGGGAEPLKQIHVPGLSIGYHFQVVPIDKGISSIATRGVFHTRSRQAERIAVLWVFCIDVIVDQNSEEGF